MKSPLTISLRKQTPNKPACRQTGKGDNIPACRQTGLTAKNQISHI